MAGRKSMVTCSVQITWPSDAEVLAPLERKLTGGVEHLADQVVIKAKANLARHNRTGRTAESVRKVKGRDGLTWFVRVGGTAKVRTAHLVEFGAGRHPISSESKKKKLRFWAGAGRSGGQYLVFSRRVQHPGVAAQPFLRPALDEVMNQAIAEIKKALAI